ncbi:MAG: hypothetical protein LN413_00185 [Candidatus Thermoplasmatota archaeon]|nr:hypothetical protein [Candidatus Thermoplasmatota archaeon]
MPGSDRDGAPHLSHPTLFDMGESHKLARVTDPATSKEAARVVEADLPRRRRWALKIVQRRGPATTLEMSRAEGNETQHELARRLPELRTLGLIERLPKRRCRRSGFKAHVWRVKE